MLADFIRKKIRKALQEAVLSAVTFENVFSVMQKVAQILKDLTAQTQNEVDDWMIRVLTQEFVQEETARQWYDFIRERLCSGDGKVIYPASTPSRFWLQSRVNPTHDRHRTETMDDVAEIFAEWLATHADESDDESSEEGEFHE